ncbi:MAG TPA: UDP-galactopyranose mutase [Solirubrobacteraceae bacterium]|nr:UDP-galactopyranose mutase [Solirubrobacteraceae bacterium]
MSTLTTSPSGRRALIVGGGLTGCTVARELADNGWQVRIHESASLAGGLVRSATMGGVVYEPHGSHIFHTEDQEVWEYAQRFVPFNNYRHRVDIVVEGKLLNWPTLLSDIDKQSDSEQIRAELAEREGIDASARAASANFEEWCLELMGPTLYHRYIYPYTKKQWGREPRLLSASWAPRRVQLRRDNDPYLFPDPYQGWPDGKEGYTDLIEGLIEHPSIELVANSTLDIESTPQAARDHESDLVILTCPLDAFSGGPLGELEWRGIWVQNIHIPYMEYAQGAMVVNYPGLEYPYIRIHEAKHASGQQCEGTVLGIEFTNAPTRYYPVPLPANEQLNRDYQELVRRTLAETSSVEVAFAGRLANYTYIDMDDCIREALDLSRSILAGDGVAA